MPQAPPSPAVSITEIGAFMAAARILCPTPFVLNSPPCPVMESIFTSSSFNKMSRPIFNVASDAYKCDRIKFASPK